MPKKPKRVKEAKKHPGWGSSSLRRNEYATKDPETGLIKSKGRARIPRQSEIKADSTAQKARQQENDRLDEEAGLISGYVHENTLSKPFGGTKAKAGVIGDFRKPSGGVRSHKMRKKIRYNRKNPPPLPKAPREPLGDLRIQILARDSYTCRYCGSRVGPFHVDHVVPWSKGGPNTVENLVTACKFCNLRKGTKIWVPKPL